MLNEEESHLILPKEGILFVILGFVDVLVYYLFYMLFFDSSEIFWLFILGILPMWYIIARGLTSSKLGGTATSLVAAIIYLLIWDVAYLLETSNLPVFIGLAIRDFVFYVSMGVAVDICFSVFHYINNFLLFLLAGGLATLAKEIGFIFITLFLTMQLPDVFDIDIDIVGALPQAIIVTISSIIVSGFLGFLIAAAIIQIKILPFNPSIPLRRLLDEE